MPAAIDAVFRYQLRTGDGYAQDFAIDTEASVSPWAGSDAAAARSLAPFATKVDGSVFALWVVGARDLNTVPVVLLDSEGRASTVLATSLKEFLGLLALGSALPEVEPATLEDVPDLENFRRWLRADLSVAVPSGAGSIIARSRAANPGLQRWLDAHPPVLRVPPRPRPAVPAPGSRPAPLSLRLVSPAPSARPTPALPGATRTTPPPPRTTPPPRPTPTPRPSPTLREP